jgi:hypothetical protein
MMKPTCFHILVFATIIVRSSLDINLDGRKYLYFEPTLNHNNWAIHCNPIMKMSSPITKEVYIVIIDGNGIMLHMNNCSKIPKLIMGVCSCWILVHCILHISLTNLNWSKIVMYKNIIFMCKLHVVMHWSNHGQETCQS